MTIEPVEEYVKRRSPSVVRILPEVLDGPENVEGPNWVLDPPRLIQRTFWRVAWPELADGDHILVLRGSIPAEGLRDIHGRPVPGMQALSGRVAVFLIDKAPAANWAHPCVYFVFQKDGSHVRAEHTWPPGEFGRMISLPRPAILP